MKRTAARIASALLAFILGTIASSLWRQPSTPQSPPPAVNVSQPLVNKPATTGMAVAIPVETPGDLVFAGGLSVVSNEVQLSNEFLRYKINVRYPQIEGSDTLPIRKLNANIERLVTQKYQWLLHPSREDLRYYKKGLHPEAFNSLDLSYEVILATDSFLSIYFEGFGYGIGAAHSVQYSFVINYDLKSKREVKLADIFKPGSKYLKTISKLCTEELSRGESGDSLSLKELAPVAANFESWNMTPAGIRFNFDACKLSGCADGKQQVVIPFATLRPLLSIR
jgi:hypothetical protein